MNNMLSDLSKNLAATVKSLHRFEDAAALSPDADYQTLANLITEVRLASTIAASRAHRRGEFLRPNDPTQASR